MTLQKASNADLFNAQRERLHARLCDPSVFKMLPSNQRDAIVQFKDQPISYDQFAQIPLATKMALFGDESPLLSKDTLARPRHFVPAAGTSRDLLAFRFRDLESEATQFTRLAQLATGMWNIDPKSTLIVNAYPTGINVAPSYYAIDCGAKPEVVALALNSIGKRFSNVILVSQPHLLRYMAVHQMLPKAMLPNLFFAVGGTWVPPTYFQTLALAGMSQEAIAKKVLCLYGIAEVGLGIGIGTPDLHALRGADTGQLFHLGADMYFLEVVDGVLAVTTLDSQCPTPLLRYVTGDVGEILTQTNAKSSLLRLWARPPRTGIKPPVTDMQVETVLHSSTSAWNHLTGTYLIKRDALHLEYYPHRPPPPAFQAALAASLGMASRVIFTPQLVTPNHTWADLLRKPSPYDLSQ